MADNVTLNSGSGGSTLATDDVTDAGGAHYQRVKLTDGTANSETHIQAGNGTSANALRVTVSSDSTGVLSVDDNGGSLTVDGTVTVDGNETENAAVAGNPVLIGARYDLTPRTLNDGDAGALAVDVNGHLITSTHANSVALTDNVSNTANILVDHTDSFMVNASFGYNFDGTTWDRIRGDATNGLLVNLGANNDVTVSGTVTANLSATDNAVLDQLELNTSYGDSVGGGTEAAALRVTIANDSTGVLTVDDGGSTLSIDDGGGAITVDGTVTANLSATDNTVLDNIDTQTTPAQSMYRNIDANAEAAIKGSAGVLHWLHAMNLTAAKAYVHLYNATTASVTPGTTTPDLTFPIPTQGDTNGAGFNLPLGPNGQDFSTAITIVVTTTLDGSTGDPGTNGVIINAGYT